VTIRRPDRFADLTIPRLGKSRRQTRRVFAKIIGSPVQEICTLGSAANHMPMLTINEASDELRVSRRWLEYWLAANPVDAAGVPFYVRMGRSKKFTATDIERMLAHMRDLERVRLGPRVTAAAGTANLIGRLAQLGSYNDLVKLREKTKPKQPQRRMRLPRFKPKAED
jgi:hypothetical protein